MAMESTGSEDAKFLNENWEANYRDYIISVLNMMSGEPLKKIFVSIDHFFKTKALKLVYDNIKMNISL